MPITFTEDDFTARPKDNLVFTEDDFTAQPVKKSRLKPVNQFNKVDRIANYFLPQAFSEQEYAPGEKNIFGNIQHALSRPGGAVRSAILPQGKSRLEAAVSGFQKPENAPTFQEEVYKKFGPELTGNKALNFARAFPSVFAGTALDMATDPVSYAGGIAARFLGKTKAVKAITGEPGRKLVKTTIQEIMESPIAESAKRGFVKAVDNVKLLGDKLPKVMNREWILKQPRRVLEVADDTVKGIQEEYRYLYDDIGIGKQEVNKTELKEIIYDLLKGATKEEADEIISNLKIGISPLEAGSTELPATLNTVQKIKGIVQKDIPESVWMKGKKGFDLTPMQAKKVKAYFKLKNITEKTLAGTEEGSYLEYLDKKATDTYRLTKTIKRMVIDQTGEPTETGRLFSAFGGKPQQVSRENLFYRLKELNEDAQGIIGNMNKFRKRQAIKRIGFTATGGFGLYEIGKKLMGK